NFEATPPMEGVMNRVMKVPADAYKVVTTARKPSDNARVLTAAKSMPKERLIVLAMCAMGFPTRVRSPVFAGAFTSAAPTAVGRRGRGESSLSAHSRSRGVAGQERRDLGCDSRSLPRFDLPPGDQPRFLGKASGCCVPAVPGIAHISARFLFTCVQAAAFGF